MRKILFTLIIFATFSTFAQIGVYNFTGTSCSNTAITTNNLTSGTFSSVSLSPTNPICTTNVNNVLRTHSWTTSTSIVTSQYLQFTITAGTKSVIVREISLRNSRTTNGPQRLRISHNFGGSFSTSSSDLTVTTSPTNSNWSFSPFELLPGNSVIFRIYAWNSTGVSPTARNLDIDDLTINGCEEEFEPTLIASNPILNVSTSGLSLSWISGNGSNCIILCKPNSNIVTPPSDNNDYSGLANSTFINVDDIDGAQVMYAGTNISSFDIIGLTSNTDYYIAIFEYNSGSSVGCSENYLTASFLSVLTTTSIALSSTWSGTTDVDWFNGTNWDNGVPTSSTDVVIDQSNYTNAPEIAGLGAVCKGLTISGGSTLLMSNGGSLDVNENFINDGTFTAGDGLVSLVGTDNQTLGGTSGTSFYDLTINKSSNGVSLSSATSITNFLRIVSGTLTTNANLTLNSTATQTASLIDDGAGLSGTVNIQRYSPNTVSTGHYVSSPITSAVFSSVSISGSNLLLYSENGTPARSSATYAGSFRRVTNQGSPSNMTPGRGFSIRQVNGNVTFGFSGTPNNGDVSIAITNTGGVAGSDGLVMPTSLSGWNLIGNPYPSAIYWRNVTKPVGTSAYLFNGTGYTTLVETDNTTPIPMGQGFFVLAPTGGGTVTFRNSDRIGTGISTSNYYRTEEEPKYFHLDLLVTNTPQPYTETALFTFNANASDGLDNFDSRKLMAVLTTIPNLYSTVEGNPLALNALNDSNYSKTVPLTITYGIDGDFTFSARDLSSFYPKVNVFLADAEKPGVLVDLKSNPTYTFTKVGDNVTNRFSLVFSPDSTIPDPGTVTGTSTGVDLTNVLRFVADEEETSINTLTGINGTPTAEDDPFTIYSFENKVNIQFVHAPKGNVSIFAIDALGKEIFVQPNTQVSGNHFDFSIDKTGIYFVKVVAEGKQIMKKLFINY